MSSAVKGPETIGGEERMVGPVPGPFDQPLPYAEPRYGHLVLSKLTGLSRFSVCLTRALLVDGTSVFSVTNDRRCQPLPRNCSGGCSWS